jgi:hypothetical protein
MLVSHKFCFSLFIFFAWFFGNEKSHQWKLDDIDSANIAKFILFSSMSFCNQFNSLSLLDRFRALLFTSGPDFGRWILAIRSPSFVFAWTVPRGAGGIRLD